MWIPNQKNQKNVSLSQTLPGYLITALPSVCVPALSVWIHSLRKTRYEDGICHVKLLSKVGNTGFSRQPSVICRCVSLGKTLEQV